MTTAVQRPRILDLEAVIESADERDALVGMRGIMIGFALTIPFWALVAAIFVLA